MPEPLTAEALAAMRARVDDTAPVVGRIAIALFARQASDDRKALLGEVERLRSLVGPTHESEAAHARLCASDAAVRAVLALHVQMGIYDLADDCACDVNDPGYDDVHTENSDGETLCRVRVLWWACRECTSDDADRAIPYPCPTRQAITEAGWSE